MKIFYSYIPLKFYEEQTMFDVFCIKLSSTILRNLGYKVGIYSNKTFIDLLKSKFVELDFYEDIEDEVKQFVNEKLFAFGKIYANSIQTEPFIQIDYDTFIFEDFHFNRFDSNFIFGFREMIGNYSNSADVLNWKNIYLDSYIKLQKKFDLPFIQKCYPLLAFNCNVVGASKHIILANAYKELVDFTKKNYKLINSFSGNTMAVIEQLLIVGQLITRGVDINKDVTMCSNKNMVDFIDIGNNTTKLILSNNEYLLKTDNVQNDCPKNMIEMLHYNFNGYLHLLGSRNLITIKNMVYFKIKKIDPEYIKKIEKTFGTPYAWQKNIYKTLL
jgi:hypothetical protein